MTSFKRARSEEQRVERRRQILDTAAAMLAEMPASQISLNALSRRACLAKSNVLRYFESREAVLLELLTRAAWERLAAMTQALEQAVDPGKGPRERGDRLAATIADSLAADPQLCDLVSVQASVLEHNVSPALAAEHKHETHKLVERFSAIVFTHMPELGPQDAAWFARAVVMEVGTMWIYSQPSAAVLAAYAANPELAALQPDFASSLRETLEVLLAGLLARGKAH
ncbi:TetR family transcriptional regulator [Amycolatopsis sp. NPDC059021]|uniref:TetR/AcrR family transcriptional regulator n=1 Tax=Amycolatopsis sp. NPDC059021 TaxID=3346704 RepID=UPI00366F68B5